MPKRINPQDQWETDFQVPLPGEPRNIGPLETLFQRLLNRTERLKNRIGAILGLPWDATPPDTLAGLAGRVRTLENGQGGTTLSVHRTAPVLDHPDGSVTTTKLANGAVTLQKLANTAFSADLTPNILVLRTAQGGVQDGAVFDARTVIRVNGIYAWSGNSGIWVPLAKWTVQISALVGIFADVYIVRLAGYENIGSRLRVRAAFVDGAPVHSRISLATDSFGVVANAVLVQTGTNTVELWGYFLANTNRIYVQGLAGINRGSIELTPYGDVTGLGQDTPPPPIDGGLYVDWNTAPFPQTFLGPGYIVAASRGPNSGYIRYDNGVQTCWSTVNIGSDTWTFPAAFASAPQVQATAEASAPHLVTITSVSPTGVGVLRTDLSGTTQSGTVHLYAIGLWK